VVLEEEASVWFGAVLRGDIEPIRVGPRTNVQDRAVLHTDAGFPTTIGAGVTIGHGATLHGCTVGDGALVGMGAIVLNGAVVEPGAMVGAGALVPAGRRIPGGMLATGVPARVVRPLTREEVHELDAGPRRYLARWQGLYHRVGHTA